MSRLLRLGPVALLLAFAAGLAASWGRLPARYPVHWGTRGADRFVELSPWAVARPLLLGLVVVAWLGAVRRFILAHSAPVEDAARSRRLVDLLTVASQWFAALLFGMASVPRQSPFLVLLGVGIGLLFLPAALVAAYAGRPAPPPAAPPPAPPGGWLFVPRRVGVGLGIDLRHPAAGRALLLLASGPVLLLVLGRLL